MGNGICPPHCWVGGVCIKCKAPKEDVKLPKQPKK